MSFFRIVLSITRDDHLGSQWFSWKKLSWTIFIYVFVAIAYCNKLKFRIGGPSWSWSYGSWIYNYLCNQCLSPLFSCEFEPCSWRGVLDTTLCDKVCEWLATGLWFSLGPPVSSTNKTDRHDITEILRIIKHIIYMFCSQNLIHIKFFSIIFFLFISAPFSLFSTFLSISTATYM
jgi:hypothetical protein